MHVLTHSQAELQDVYRSFLLQETHKTKQQILLLSDLLQIQLQHLTEEQTKETTCNILFETFTRHKNSKNTQMISQVNFEMDQPPHYNSFL